LAIAKRTGATKDGARIAVDRARQRIVEPAPSIGRGNGSLSRRALSAQKN
jgi:hypothetical protein